MKLRCLTSLFAVFFMVSIAGAAEIYNKDGNILSIYGGVVGGNYFSSSNIRKDSAHSLARFGVFGQTQVNEQIVGFGVWEHEVSLQNVEGACAKFYDQSLLGYAGIKFGDFGSVDYGRNFGILYDVGSYTDVMPEFGGDLFFTDNFLSNRSSNVVTYRNKDFFNFIDGLDFSLQYQNKNSINQATGRTVKTANGEGYGISASYTLENGIAASAAYTNSKRLIEQINLDNSVSNENVNAEAYYVGLKYDNHGMYAAATYGETYSMTPFGDFNNFLNSDNIYGFANKVKNIALVAQYQFDCGLRPTVSYLHSKMSDINNDSCNSGVYLKRCVTLGTGYLFNKNISTTVDYRINLINKSDFARIARINVDNVIALGVAYLF